MSQSSYLAPLFSSSIVAEMNSDAEYPFAAIMQGSAFIYLGFILENTPICIQILNHQQWAITRNLYRVYKGNTHKS